MKKVCIDARMIGCSGIGTYIQNLLERLKNRSFELIPIVSRSALAEFEFLEDFPCIFLEDKHYSLKEQINLPRKIPKVDLFWSPHFNAPLLPIRAKKRLVTIHDVFHLAKREEFTLLEQLYSSLLLRNAAIRASKIITVSNFSASEIEKLILPSRGKVEAIPLGVDHNFYALSGDRAAITKKYALPKRFFLFVGSCKKHKNLDRLLKIFNSLGKEFSLCLVGSYQSLPKLGSNIILLGKVPKEDLPTLYQMAEGLIFPSLYEGFGLPPLEAMAASCPVIASRIPPIEEVCQDSVCYVNPKNYDSIEMGINKVLKDNLYREELIKKGQKRANDFSWEKTVEAHKKVIESLL